MHKILELRNWKRKEGKLLVKISAKLSSIEIHLTWRSQRRTRSRMKW